MQLKKLTPRDIISTDKKLTKCFNQLEVLIEELRSRNLPSDITSKINGEIEKVNTVSDTGFKKQLRKSKSKVLRILEKELKLVPKNYYRNQWMVLGMSVFGIPIGVAFGTSLDNMGFLGIGLPIGMVIGIGVGSAMDKKAQQENRQLNLEA